MKKNLTVAAIASFLMVVVLRWQGAPLKTPSQPKGHSRPWTGRYITTLTCIIDELGYICCKDEYLAGFFIYCKLYPFPFYCGRNLCHEVAGRNYAATGVNLGKAGLPGRHPGCYREPVDAAKYYRKFHQLISATYLLLCSYQIWIGHFHTFVFARIIAGNNQKK